MLDRELDCEVEFGGHLMSSSKASEHARELLRAEMKFGSHSVGHPALSKVHLRSMTREGTRESSDSMGSVGETLGSCAAVVAYSINGRAAINENGFEAARAAVCRSGAAVIPADQPPSQSKPSDLMRGQPERYVHDGLFRTCIVFCSVFVR